MPDPAKLQSHLQQDLQKMGLQYPISCLERLISYIQLLSKWNRVYNLTAITKPVDMLKLHLLDSLSLEPYIPIGKRIIDVGAGAGLPGIPLAIVRQDLHLLELEKSEKKCRFMRQAVVELGLDNVEISNSRVQDINPDPGGDIIVSRAFASLSTMLGLVKQLSACSGSIFAMKGKLDQDELSDLPAGFHIENVYRVSLTGVEAERHIIHIRPA
jgi:16S rRNA (guanine527-N7)-methyltransferase